MKVIGLAVSEELQKEIVSLKEQNEHQQQQIEELSTQVKWYEEQFRLNKQREFGRSSEKSSSDQLGIFNEAEVEAKPEVPERASVEVSYSRRQGKETKEEKLRNHIIKTIEYR